MTSAHSTIRFSLSTLVGAYLCCLAGVAPASNMSFSNLPQTAAATDWSGVALLSVNTSAVCSAVAIAPGALLTAAHCVAPNGAASVTQNVTALLRSLDQSITVTAAAVIPYPTYQLSYLGGDLAVVILNETLPSWVATYSIAQTASETGRIFEAAGFAGATLSGFHTYQNRFENGGLFWASDWGSFDYDSGLDANNALAAFGPSDLGVSGEGMIRLGDSGGPALVDGMLVGITSGLWRYQYLLDGNLTSADVDSIINSSMGEIGFFLRLPLYRDWIMSTIAAYATVGEVTAESTAVPEPATYSLTAAALAILCRVARIRRRKFAGR